MSASGKDLAALLASERDQRVQVLTEALLARRADPDASGERDAADRLLRRLAPWALDLAGAAASLLGAVGDERVRRFFLACSVQPGGPSQTEMAAKEGVTPQYVGQVALAAARRARQLAASSPAPLSWAVRTLRDRLGTLTSDRAAGELLDLLGGRDQADLLLWLAGPYVPVRRRPGWLAVDPVLAVRVTTRCLAADGGVRRLDDVVSELADERVRSHQLRSWLAASSAVVVHDLTVRVDGSLPDALERVLDAYGCPRSVAELAADLAAGGRAVDDKAIVAALRSRRFVRLLKREGKVALAAWDATGEGRRKPKRAQKARRASVVARPSQPVAGEVRGEDGPRPERLWLWVKVDDEALRGAEADVPAALVEALGLEPPARRTFSSRWGPVTLANDGAGPTRGPVRAVALATGARRDDTLLLGFSTNGEVAVEVRPASPPAGGQTGADTAGSSQAEPVTGSQRDIASGGTR